MKSFLLKHSFIILMLAYFCFALFIQNYVNIFRILTSQELLFDSRVWHLYVNYFDFGFSKRALIGTIVNIFQLDSIIQNEYILNLTLTYLSAVAIILISLFHLIKNNLLHKNKMLFVLFLMSPATLHYFYWAGNIDNFLLLILFVMVLFIKSTWITSCLIFLGLLAHESFMFFVPMICVLKIIELSDKNLRSKFISLLPFFVSAGLGAIITIFYGSIEMNQDVYFDLMKEKIPLTYEKLLQSGELYSRLWWSGFNEITYSVSEYRSNEGMKIEAFTSNLKFVIPAILIALYFPFLAAYHSEEKLIMKCLIFLALIFPLLMSILANDFWRYASFIMIISFVFIFKLLEEEKISTIPKYQLYLFIPFCFLGPYGGSDMYAPFHVLYVILDKVIP